MSYLISVSLCLLVGKMGIMQYYLSCGMVCKLNEKVKVKRLAVSAPGKHSIDHSESHVQEGMSVPHHLEQN